MGCAQEDNPDRTVRNIRKVGFVQGCCRVCLRYEVRDGI